MNFKKEFVHKKLCCKCMRRVNTHIQHKVNQFGHHHVVMHIFHHFWFFCQHRLLHTWTQLFCPLGKGYKSPCISADSHQIVCTIMIFTRIFYNDNKNWVFLSLLKQVVPQKWVPHTSSGALLGCNDYYSRLYSQPSPYRIVYLILNFIDYISEIMKLYSELNRSVRKKIA